MSLLVFPYNRFAPNENHEVDIRRIWCKQYCQGIWEDLYHSWELRRFLFELEEDAVAFDLVWSNTRVKE